MILSHICQGGSVGPQRVNSYWKGSFLSPTYLNSASHDMKCPWWFCISSWRGPVVGAAVCCCRWNVRESINTFLCAFPTISLSRNKLNFQVWNGGSFHSATRGSTALHLICQSSHTPFSLGQISHLICYMLFDTSRLRHMRYIWSFLFSSVLWEAYFNFWVKNENFFLLLSSF